MKKMFFWTSLNVICLFNKDYCHKSFKSIHISWKASRYSLGVSTPASLRHYILVSLLKWPGLTRCGLWTQTQALSTSGNIYWREIMTRHWVTRCGVIHDLGRLKYWASSPPWATRLWWHDVNKKDGGKVLFGKPSPNFNTVNVLWGLIVWKKICHV